jgi:hypothetical protein
MSEEMTPSDDEWGDEDETLAELAGRFGRRAVVAEAENARLRAQVEAVRALHQRVHHRPEDMESGDWCGGCGRDWPCSTKRLLSDEGKPDAADA